MGNRGILHDDHRRIVRLWQSRRWIACRLRYKGIRRQIMRPHAWTELFFLDEATAFAAGHRPCAECRREDYRRFQSLWQRHVGTSASANDMDARLDTERRTGRKKRTYRADIRDLPSGAFIAIDDRAWLVWNNSFFAWSDAGYHTQRARPTSEEVDVLTPPSIVAVFKAGYIPLSHPTAHEQ